MVPLFHCLCHFSVSVSVHLFLFLLSFYVSDLNQSMNLTSQTSSSVIENLTFSLLVSMFLPPTSGILKAVQFAHDSHFSSPLNGSYYALNSLKPSPKTGPQRLPPNIAYLYFELRNWRWRGRLNNIAVLSTIFLLSDVH